MTKQCEALDMIAKLQMVEQTMEAACKRIDELKAENKALKEALAQPEQEPVARMLVKDGIGWIEWNNPIHLPDGLHDLHTTPPQRTWIGLTPQEITEIMGYEKSKFVRGLIENALAKLKEKNT